LNKNDLIDAVARQANLPRREAKAAVEAILETVTEALKEGDQVSFSGFGKFHVQSRPPRAAINPRTKTRVHVPARGIPKFSPGSRLKAAVKASDVEPGDVIIVTGATEPGDLSIAIGGDVAGSRVGFDVTDVLVVREAAALPGDTGVHKPKPT
jgi:nucleoid DNA-binding protein